MYRFVSVPRLAALILAVLSLLLFDRPLASAASDLVIGNYQLVSKTRVSRTEYEYTYKASIMNNGTEDAVNIIGKVASLASTTVVTDDSLTFSTIPAGSTVTSSDTFKVKINLSYAFNAANLSWNFLYDPNPGIPELLEGIIYPSETKETMMIKHSSNNGEAYVEAVQGRVIAQFKLNTPIEVAEAWINTNGGIIEGKIPSLKFYAIEVIPGSEIAFINALIQNEIVDYAEPDYVEETLYTSSPSDYINDFDYLKTIKAFEAWAYLGDLVENEPEVDLGVVDGGFSGLTSGNQDFLKDKKSRLILDTIYRDEKQHGAWVTAVMAAAGDNAYGNIGIAWNSKVSTKKAIFSFEKKAAITSLIGEGADIINISMGRILIKNEKCDLLGVESHWIRSSLNKMVESITAINEQNPNKKFLIFVAAGNENCDLGEINNKPSNLIIVGGSNGAEATTSNYGTLIDLTAPYNVKINDYATGILIPLKGTSLSSPIAAGAAALIWSHDSTLKTADNIAKRMKVTANKNPNAINVEQFSSAGVLDIYAALKNNLAITTSTLQVGNIGTTYPETTLSTSGAHQPIDKWILSAGKLPNGLELDGSTGRITGTPTTVGTYNFTIKVVDDAVFEASKSFSITIGDLSISTSTLPDVTVGTAYTQTLSASGGTGPYTWSIPSGSGLPPGLVLDNATGIISGTPTTAGIYGFTVEVTDETGFKASKTFTITVATPVETLAITTSTLSNGTVGSSYNQTLSATGGTGDYTWSILPSLPGGLNLNGNVISGTPTTAGTYDFTVTVMDAGEFNDSKSFSITVSGLAIPISTLQITAPLMTWIPRVSGTDKGLQAFASNGSKMIAAGMSGTILSSLDGINWTQENSGTTYNFYGATYANGLFVLVGAAYPGGPSVIVTSPDGVTWTERNLDTLSSGLNNVAYGNGIFVTVGNHNVVYTSNDGVNWSFGSIGTDYDSWWHLNDVKYLNNKFVAVGHNGRVTHSLDGLNWVNTSIFDGMSQLHGITYGNGKYVASGQYDDLSDGLLTVSEDLINWTQIYPTPASSLVKRVAFSEDKFIGSAGNGILTSIDGFNWEHTSNVSTAEVGWDGSKFIAMGMNGTIITSTAAIPEGLVGTAYNADLSANGGTAPYTWSVFSGVLPPGLALNSSTGVISGTPTADGNYDLTLSVVDANSEFGSKDIIISVLPVYATFLPWSEMYGNSSNTSRSSLNGPFHLDNAISISVPGIIYYYNNDPVLIGANNTVCFSFYCFDENGNIQRQLPARAGALANDGTLYAYYSGTIIALDRNGSEKWRYTVPYIITPPSLGPDGTIYFMNGYGYVAEYKSELFALNPDGTLKWKYMVNGPQREYQKYIAIGQEGNIYINAPDGNLLSLNPDGSLAWSISAFESWCGWSSCFLRGAPVIGPDGTIYVTRRYSVLAVDPKGIVKWSTSLPGSTEGIPQLGPDGTFYIKTHQYKYDPVLGLIGSFSLSAVSPDGFIIWSKEKDIDISAIGNNGLLYGYEGTDVKIFDADANVIAVGPSKKGLLRLGFNETLFLKVFGSEELLKFPNSR